MAVSRRPVLDFWPYQAMVRALWPSGARRQGSVEFSGQPNRRCKTRSYSYQNNVEEYILRLGLTFTSWLASPTFSKYFKIHPERRWVDLRYLLQATLNMDP